METIEEIRRANLDRLLAEGWTQADLGRALGRDPRQVSQWFGKGAARSMSSAMARSLEIAVGKPRAWLDNVNRSAEELSNPEGAHETGRLSHAAGPDPAILHEAVTLLLFDLDHGGPRPARSASELLLDLYRRLEAGGGRLTKTEEWAFEDAARSRGLSKAGGATHHAPRKTAGPKRIG